MRRLIKIVLMTVTLLSVAFFALVVLLPVPDCTDNDRNFCSAAYTFSNGDIYDGEWVDNKKEGQGTLIAAHGSKYIGEFWKGKFDGKGTFTFYDSIYVGEFSRGKFEGKGSYITADGTIREGTWKNNRLNGQGNLLWANGDKYVGEFKGGEKNGQGTLTTADGTVTQGLWKYNKLITGQDTLILPSGSIYVGEIKDRKITGQGTLTWANGEKYVGEFKDGEKIGQGTLTTADGAVGEGTWKDNKLDGQGTLTWANGDKYVGDFKDNQINGWGTLTLQDGDKYVGEFKDRKKNGQGTLTTADGTVTEGIWRDNKFQYASKDEADAHAGAGIGTIGSESAPSQHGATIYSSTSGSMVVGRHLSIASDINTCTPKRVVLVWEFYDQVVNKDGEIIVEGTLIDATFKSGETMINLPFITVDVFKPEYAPFALYTFVSEELAQLKLLDDGDISISLETNSHQGIDSSETFQLPKSVNLIDKSKDYCLEESSLVVSTEASTKVTAADYDKGVEAYESGDYKAALAELVPLAEQGNAAAQAALGTMYFKGQGVPKNMEVALEWYTLAAEQGNDRGQYNLGVMYNYGWGVQANDNTAVKWYTLAAEQGYADAQTALGTKYQLPRGFLENDKTAVKWYTLAARQGNARGQNNLAVMYQLGKGVQENDKTAVKWYTLAADQGSAHAQNNLGDMYKYGEGVQENHKTAVKWYTLAADQGHAKAQFNLGNMYDNGEGVPESDKTAVKWYTLAAEQGNKDGLMGLELLHSSSLTSDKSEDECIIDGDTVTLTGTPSLEVFPGRPEYKSIEEGDEERWYWILNTKKYTCGMRLSYESGELYQVDGDFSHFQLANYKFSEKMLNDAQSNKIVNGKGVITITGQIMFGHNANHVTPVVLLDGLLDTQEGDDVVILQETDGNHFLTIDGKNKILTIHQNKEYEWFSTLFNNLKKAQKNEDANIKIGVYDDDMLDITAHANTSSKVIDGKKAVVIKLDGDGFKKFQQMMDKQLSNPKIGYISIYIDHSNKFYSGDFLQ